MNRFFAHIPKLFFWSMWPLALVIVYFGYLQANIDAQIAENTYLNSKIRETDKKLGDLRDIQNVRRAVLERMEVTQDLEGRNANQKLVFRSFVNLHPSISLDSIDYKEASLSFKGRFTSQDRIAVLARELESIPVIQNVIYKIDNGRFSMDLEIGSLF